MRVGGARADGTWRHSGGAIHWRVGRAELPREDQSAIGYAWVEEIVRVRRLFPWRGVEWAAGAKPRFIGDAPADFSISHSGGWVLVAVGGGNGIGADVESAPFDAFESRSLVRRMCTPRELADAPRDCDRRRLALAARWTAKEATLKATGEGLARDPRTVDVDEPDAWSSALPSPSAVGHLAAHGGSSALLARIVVSRRGRVCVSSGGIARISAGTAASFATTSPRSREPSPARAALSDSDELSRTRSSLRPR